MRTQPDDAASTGHVLCRVCNKGCPMIAEVRDGRLAAVRGNKDNELFQGYTCVKGRAMPAFINGPGRLLRSQRRSAAGFGRRTRREFDRRAQCASSALADCMQ